MKLRRDGQPKRTPPPPPKKHGAKDKIPHGRTLKASVRAIIHDVVQHEHRSVRSAIVRGINAGPRDAHHYLKLAAEYTDGKPDSNLRIQFNEDELATAKETLNKKLDMILERIPPKTE